MCSLVCFRIFRYASFAELVVEPGTESAEASLQPISRFRLLKPESPDLDPLSFVSHCSWPFESCLARCNSCTSTKVSSVSSATEVVSFDSPLTNSISTRETSVDYLVLSIRWITLVFLINASFCLHRICQEICTGKRASN